MKRTPNQRHTSNLKTHKGQPNAKLNDLQNESFQTVQRPVPSPQSMDLTTITFLGLIKTGHFPHDNFH
jgi:hypothetical protein